MDMYYSDSLFKVQCGDVLSGKSCNYHIDSFLGQGGYGKVAKCRISKTNEYVAVKVLRKDGFECGRFEAKTMEKIRKLDPEKNNMVMLNEHFIHRNHFCLVYDLMDVSLFDFMEKRDFRPLELDAIRVISQQILVALKAMRSMNLVHGDIKPENIMLVNHQSQPFKVKLIDFGLATEAPNLWMEGVCQNLPYRPPEVLLHLPTLDEAVDMWSFAGVLAFLYLGDDLYPNKCKYEAMRMICDLNGQPNNDFLDSALDSDSFFDLVQDAPERMWYLKSPDQYAEEAEEEIVEYCGEFCDCSSLDDLILWQRRKMVPIIHRDTQAFISLLKQMLAVNPQDRITPNEALHHDFFTLKHFPAASNDPYVVSTKEMMMVCHNEEERSVPLERREENSGFSGSYNSRDLKIAAAPSLSTETTNDKIDRVLTNSNEENIKVPGICEKPLFRSNTSEASKSKEEVKPAQRSVTKETLFKNRTCEASTSIGEIQLLPRSEVADQQSTSKIQVYSDRDSETNSSKEDMLSTPITSETSQQGTSKNLDFRNRASEAKSNEEEISAPKNGTEDQQGDPTMQLAEEASVCEVKPVKKRFRGIRKFCSRLLKLFCIRPKKD